MNNEEQSAGTIAGQSTEAEVTNVSHNNGNTHVGCSLSDVSTETKPEEIKTVIGFCYTTLNGVSEGDTETIREIVSRLFFQRGIQLQIIYEEYHSDGSLVA